SYRQINAFSHGYPSANSAFRCLLELLLIARFRWEHTPDNSGPRRDAVTARFNRAEQSLLSFLCLVCFRPEPFRYEPPRSFSRWSGPFRSCSPSWLERRFAFSLQFVRREAADQRRLLLQLCTTELHRGLTLRAVLQRWSSCLRAASSASY